MAQHNRRRSRKGGTPGRRVDPSDAIEGGAVRPDGDLTEPGKTPESSPASGAQGPQRHGLYESGEEALEQAQVALGRPDPAERPSAQELSDFEEADAGSVAGGGASDDRRDRGGSAGALSTRRGDRDEPDRTTAVAPRQASLVSRAIGFVQGSWRELKRVQWPDRRQVFQATGVVLGFVIVAGAFLGLASFVANKIVNLILYGHG